MAYHGEPIKAGKQTSSVPDVKEGQLWLQSTEKSGIIPERVKSVESINGFMYAFFQSGRVEAAVNMTKENGWAESVVERERQKFAETAKDAESEWIDLERADKLGLKWNHDPAREPIGNIHSGLNIDAIRQIVRDTWAELSQESEKEPLAGDEDDPVDDDYDDCEKGEAPDELDVMRSIDNDLKSLPIEAQRRAMIWLDARWHERKHCVRGLGT